MPINPEDVKKEFSIYDDNPDLAYFDSASTTLVPKAAIGAMATFLTSTVASSRRGAHKLAVNGSAIVEDVRVKLATFLNSDKAQVSFQKSIPSTVASLVYGYEWKKEQRNKIIISQSEEHSVLVALLRAAQVLNLQVETIPVDKNGILDMETLTDTVDEKTGIVAVGHVTVGIGASNPIEEVAKIAHENESLLLTDISRSIAFLDTPPTSLKADILLFSGNIGLMGPPGLSVQWISKTLGTKHIPGIVGGSSVATVEKTSFEPSFQPDKFESGTINIPAIAGLGAAIDYLSDLRRNDSHSHMRIISHHMADQLNDMKCLTVYGMPTERNTIFGFNVGREDSMSCHDVALFLNESNIAVRSGLVCAHPLIKPISSEGIIQASIHVYNSIEEVNRLIDGLRLICKHLL
ncbi:MAG: aminotransferase class V-fold PLP-dependent enzyme [Candidatus Thorarchaeota archaeon]